MGLGGIADHAAPRVPQLPPVLDSDAFSSEVLGNPYPFYEQLREAGPVVRLEQYDCWAMGRHAEVEAAFNDWQTYSSAAGAGLDNIRKSAGWREPSLLQDADPPVHARARDILTKLMSPPTVRGLRADFARKADRLIGDLIERRSFDAVSDVAEFFPARVFGDAMGLPREGRENLVRFGNVAFNIFGPHNWLYDSALKTMSEVAPWVAQNCKRESLRPDGLGARVYDSVDAGVISEHEGGLLVRTFLVAGTDTVVNSFSNMMYCLAGNPDQWSILRNDSSLIRKAYEEVIRIESPIQTFFRTTTCDTIVGGFLIPADQKVYLSYASANRDPRRWKNSDKFDIERDTPGHLGFGTGVHRCLGQMLARLQGEVVLSAMIARIRTIEPDGEPRALLSNTSRGFQSLPIRVQPN